MLGPTRNCSRWLAKCPTQQEVDQLKTRVSDLRKRGKGRWQPLNGATEDQPALVKKAAGLS